MRVRRTSLWEVVKLIGACIMLAAFVGFAVWSIWYEIEHPCVRWEQRPCQETYCSLYMPYTISDGRTTMTKIRCVAQDVRDVSGLR